MKRKCVTRIIHGQEVQVEICPPGDATDKPYKKPKEPKEAIHNPWKSSKKWDAGAGNRNLQNEWIRRMGGPNG